MKVRIAKVSFAIERLSLPVAAPLEALQLNAGEKLRVAERLIEDVLAALSPLENAALCISEGYLSAALPAIEQARGIIEQWPQDDLPEPSDAG